MARDLTGATVTIHTETTRVRHPQFRSHISAAGVSDLSLNRLLRPRSSLPPSRPEIPHIATSSAVT